MSRGDGRNIMANCPRTTAALHHRFTYFGVNVALGDGLSLT